ncbi:MAG: TonB-dependent receptor [Polaromonas sp.]|nr:TonB-dependent receptor [Polaromonas sp.]
MMSSRAPGAFSLCSLAAAALFAPPAFAQDASSAISNAPVRSLGMVTVTGGQPTSLPTQIPTTIEGVTRQQIEEGINATDSEDALKYLPSLLVRKRYIGDYNHAILSSRASGTGNSARSAVYADGILLSNYLGNGIANGTNYAPRWGLVTPEEIERVDVLYGPFSAAYPGNSVGAVVDYVTRMPQKFEAHAKVTAFNQNFRLYGSEGSYGGSQASASLGNRSGDWSWFINANRTTSSGQPLTFVTRTLSSVVSAANPVTGAVAGLNTRNVPWLLIGGATQYETQQEHVKLKVAYDVSPTVRASYTLGYWDNNAQNRSESYLRNAAGQPVYSGNVSINGRAYTLAASDFAASNEALTHVMHGLSVKSNTRGVFDWEVAASIYDYQTDQIRASTTAQPGSLAGGAGTLQDQDGTGWNNLALKGIWRPEGLQGAHIVDFGYQQDSYRLRILKSNAVGSWLSGGAGTLVSDVGGRTQLRSLYAQDAWTFAPKWKTVLGARAENWTASSGFTTFGVGNAANTAYAARSESFVSPKAALSYQWTDDTTLKASTGRAVRFPTVGELYGATATVNSQYVNDPNLRPEKSWTSELSAEKDFGNALLRVTLFTENTRDSLYSQVTFDPAANSNISRVQNVGRIQTRGLEMAFNGTDILASSVGKGLGFSGSVTYADSRIKENSGFVATPGDTVGKYQPRVPVWRATALVSYRFDPAWTATFGARYSGNQFSSLDNSDVNGAAYMGTSKYFTTDVRVHYKVNKQWTAAFGIDNLNNYQYWNFHPYPQRTFTAELKVAL